MSGLPWDNLHHAKCTRQIAQQSFQVDDLVPLPGFIWLDRLRHVRCPDLRRRDMRDGLRAEHEYKRRRHAALRSDGRKQAAGFRAPGWAGRRCRCPGSPASVGDRSARCWRVWFDMELAAHGKMPWMRVAVWTRGSHKHTVAQRIPRSVGMAHRCLIDSTVDSQPRS